MYRSLHLDSEPPAGLAQEYNSRIRTLCVLCTYCECTQHVLRVHSVGGLAVQHSACTLFVLRYVLYAYSGGGWDMVMGGVQYRTLARTLGVL